MVHDPVKPLAQQCVEPRQTPASHTPPIPPDGVCARPTAWAAGRRSPKPSLDGIIALERIANAGARGEVPDAQLCGWVLESLIAYRRGASFEEVFGLQRRRGGRDARNTAAIAGRDDLLRSARRFAPGRSTHEDAHFIAKRLNGYKQSAWLRERHLEDCPARHRGSFEELAWSILKLWDAELSPGRIRTILSAKCPFL